jgi:hypothetical protein
LQIPTLFGRLVYLASLRDTASNRYLHESLSSALGSEECDRTLSRSHQQVFGQWLTYSLADQKTDLEEYLSTAGGPRNAVHYRHLVPGSARAVERQLYLTDLETLMELLRYEHGGVFSLPEA